MDLLRVTYLFKRLRISTGHVFPVHEENPVYQDDYSSNEQCDTLIVSGDFLHNELPEAAIFTALVHRGLAYRSLARRLYLRSK